MPVALQVDGGPCFGLAGGAPLGVVHLQELARIGQLHASRRRHPVPTLSLARPACSPEDAAPSAWVSATHPSLLTPANWSRPWATLDKTNRAAGTLDSRPGR